MGQLRAGPIEAALYNGMYSGPWAPRAREPHGRPKTHRLWLSLPGSAWLWLAPAVCLAGCGWCCLFLAGPA